MMHTEVVEPFAEYRELGTPSLRAWKNPKTMTVDWHYGRVREYWKFQSVLDSDGMNAALLEVWRRCKPQCDRRASSRYAPGVKGDQNNAEDSQREAIRRHRRRPGGDVDLV